MTLICDSAGAHTNSRNTALSHAPGTRLQPLRYAPLKLSSRPEPERQRRRSGGTCCSVCRAGVAGSCWPGRDCGPHAVGDRL